MTRRAVVKAKLMVAVFALLGAVAANSPIQAHHAGTAFDETKQLTVKGVVKEFKWVNPHTWLYLLVPNAAGEPEMWQLEGGSVSILGRAGWNSKTLQPGDKVTVMIKPLKSGGNGGEYQTVIKEDGTKYGWGQI